jgi:malate/lactate dehydrogenase
MAGADAVVVCGGATTTEGQDRADLLLDQDAFIAEVAAAAKVRIR